VHSGTKAWQVAAHFCTAALGLYFCLDSPSRVWWK